MSPRPSSQAARVADEPPDFEWPPAADELSVYDVGPDPWPSVRRAAGAGFPPRTHAAAVRATGSQGAPSVPPPVGRPVMSPRFTLALVGAVAVAAIATAGWGLYRTTPDPVPVERVHHPAPPPRPTTAPPRLTIVATYPVHRAMSTASGAAADAVALSPAASPVDAPRIPVAPAAPHQALAGIEIIDGPQLPRAGNQAAEATSPGTGTGLQRE